jgi:DNA polymerase III subunit gamma/tau
MSYIALYRKYRSQSFDELMGQEQVTVTLQNSIRSGRIAHAYLFYGARGCGKTSTARLLARALNCVAQDGPTPTPCGECRLCVAIRDGSCMDVIEMDAASETGIDDVREKIVENVQYAPGEARFKVYIIDEVHDLSAKAFDALLKTLEEPPPHVIFVLATTEQHKVPITIRSRCMPYHFKRGTLQDLAASVQRVVDLEGCTAEPEAVQAIARSAEGSWRDALSLLEQVLAYADGHVTAALVHQAIGSVGTETLARVTETLAQGDWSATLAIAGELIDSGKDVRQLLAALSGHLRDLMLICAGAHGAAQQELGPERYSLLKAQAPLFEPATLLAMTGTLAAAEREIRFTNQHRWLLESTLLRLMPSNLAAAASERAAVVAAPPPAAPIRRETVASTPTVIPRPHPASRFEEPAVVAEAPPAVSSMPPQSAQAAEPTPAERRSEPAPAAAKSPANGQAAAAPAETGPPSRFAEDISFDVIVRAWPRIIAAFKKASPSGAPFLERGEVVELDGRTLVLAFADSFARERIQSNAKGKAKVEQVINQALNTDGYKIRCITRDLDVASPAPAPSTPAPPLAELLDIGEIGAAESAPVVEVVAVAVAVPSDDGATAVSRPESASVTAPSGASGDVSPVGQSLVQPDGNPEGAGTGESSLLAEALSVFGGSVVRTESRPLA